MKFRNAYMFMLTGSENMVRIWDAYAKNANMLKITILIVLYTGYGLGNMITTITTNSAYKISSHVITAHIMPQISWNNNNNGKWWRNLTQVLIYAFIWNARVFSICSASLQSIDTLLHSPEHTKLDRHSIDYAYLCYGIVYIHNPYHNAPNSFLSKHQQ